MKEQNELPIPPPREGVRGIVRAKHAVMQQVKGAAKDRKNQHHGFYYTGHDDVTEALHPAFLDQGIVQSVSVVSMTRESITTTTKRGEETDSIVSVQVKVQWTSLEDGSYEEALSFGESSMKGTTADLQLGKAVSYAVKVAQLKNFMLIGGYQDNEDDRREKEPEPGAPKSEPAPKEKGEVSDEQVRLLVDNYGAVKNREGLDSMRRVVSGLAQRLSDAQYELLREADEVASTRIAGAK